MTNSSSLSRLKVQIDFFHKFKFAVSFTSLAHRVLGFSEKLHPFRIISLSLAENQFGKHIEFNEKCLKSDFKLFFLSNDFFYKKLSEVWQCMAINF